MAQNGVAALIKLQIFPFQKFPFHANANFVPKTGELKPGKLHARHRQYIVHARTTGEGIIQLRPRVASRRSWALGLRRCSHALVAPAGTFLGGARAEGGR